MEGLITLIVIIIIGVLLLPIILIISYGNRITNWLDSLNQGHRLMMLRLERIEQQLKAGTVLKEEVTPPVEAPVVVEEKPLVVSSPPVEEIVPVEEEQPVAAPPVLKATAAPKEKKNDFEKFFGINLLPKIGIATLVLGIAYFVKYAIDRNWINETGRVAIGILAGAALIGVAHRLRNNYRAFSSILVGGGIAALYFTIAIAFWEYHLFSQTVAFVLLIFITAISVFLSIIYDKIELIIFSQLGGFAAPLIVSTGTGNYVVLFSYLLILNTAMLIVAFKKNWRIISVIAYVLTLIFYWAWLFNSFEEQYMGATLFGVLFFIQFYLVAMIDYYKSTVRKITPFQAAVILINNLSF